MGENLNLVDILKDCPRGTELYSVNHGIVKFEEIKTDSNYPIVFYYRNSAGERYIDNVTKDGRPNINYCGECTLFPSKENREWSKFKVESELVDGEIYYAKINLVEWVYIYRKNYTLKTNHYVAILNNSWMEFNNICTMNNEDIKELRKATEEEKRLFFELIEKNGRKWDADKKELVRIGKKFDVYTLQPFDKVLVRDNNKQKWKCNLFDRINGDLMDITTEKTVYLFICITGKFYQCIPYNDETKHLVNSTKMPLEKYINWEE